MNPKITKLVRIQHLRLSERTLREMFLMLKSETLKLSFQAGNLMGEKKMKFLSLMLPDKQRCWVPGIPQYLTQQPEVTIYLSQGRI